MAPARRTNDDMKAVVDSRLDRQSEAEMASDLDLDGERRCGCHRTSRWRPLGLWCLATRQQPQPPPLLLAVVVAVVGGVRWR